MAIANSDGSIIITTKLDVTPVSKAINALKSKFASLKEQRSAIQTLTNAIKDQQFVIKDLEKEYAVLVAQGKGNSTNAEELKSRISELKAELQQLTFAASAMGVKTAAASTKAAQGLKKFGKRIAGIVKSALIFSVLYKVMQAVVKLFQNILMSDDEFRQDWEELKAAFYTAAYPIINLIVPAIKWIVQQVRDWAVSIGKVAAALQGMSYSELVDQAKASKEAADNYADMEKSSKKTADNVKKQLAGFDDIQILSSGNEEEQGTGLGGFEGLGQYDTSGEKSMLDDLMKAIGGALIAVGLILLFHGQLAWGIGFIIVGAATLTVTMASASEFEYDGIIQMLTTIMGVAGGALLALGIILLCLGGVVGKGVAIGMIIAGGALIVSAVAAQAAFAPNDIAAWLSLILGIAGGALLALGIILVMVGSVPLGVGMIIAGAVSIVSAVALNFDFIVEAIKGPIGAIMALVGGALLVIGIILVCTGVLPLGIALIAVGAVSLAAPVALNFNGIVNNIKNFLFENPLLISLISGGLLVLGIILCVAGILPLGIGLIAIGAVGLAAEVALHWGTIKEKISNAFYDVINWVKTYGLLVIGILLCLTGTGIPLGIALIVKWAKDGAENGVPIATAIVDKVKEIWASIKAFWDENIAPIFTAKFWRDLAKKCGNGLIQGFESAINGIIGAFESMINWIVNGLNKIAFDIPDWLGGGSFGINIPNVSFNRVSIPRLAKGAVIPPNKEFLAVLGDQKQGTNIEAPLQTIVDAFNIALSQNGGYNGGNTEVVLEIDGREFGRAVVEQGNRENRRIGTRLVIA